MEGAGDGARRGHPPLRADEHPRTQAAPREGAGREAGGKIPEPPQAGPDFHRRPQERHLQHLPRIGERAGYRHHRYMARTLRTRHESWGVRQRYAIPTVNRSLPYLGRGARGLAGTDIGEDGTVKDRQSRDRPIPAISEAGRERTTRSCASVRVPPLWTSEPPSRSSSSTSSKRFRMLRDCGYTDIRFSFTPVRRNFGTTERSPSTSMSNVNCTTPVCPRIRRLGRLRDRNGGLRVDARGGRPPANHTFRFCCRRTRSTCSTWRPVGSSPTSSPRRGRAHGERPRPARLPRILRQRGSDPGSGTARLAGLARGDPARGGHR